MFSSLNTKNNHGREMTKRISGESQSGSVDEYIAKHSEDIQARLKEIRSAIRQVARDAMETTSYFHIPGYAYPGYDYNGMFAWFDLQKSYINLRLRPPTIQNHKKQLEAYETKRSLVRFPLDQKIPVALVKKLVKESVRIMKEKPKKSTLKP
jgi:uncharacterized protein YdhG (YjbR/CyaY superfamily)